mgnify:FL=1|jgi:hypothetical protein
MKKEVVELSAEQKLAARVLAAKKAEEQYYIDELAKMESERENVKQTASRLFASIVKLERENTTSIMQDIKNPDQMVRAFIELWAISLYCCCRIPCRVVQ